MMMIIYLMHKKTNCGEENKEKVGHYDELSTGVRESHIENDLFFIRWKKRIPVRELKGCDLMWHRVCRARDAATAAYPCTTACSPVRITLPGALASTSMAETKKSEVGFRKRNPERQKRKSNLI
jgi:hypothetical protein